MGKFLKNLYNDSCVVHISIIFFMLFAQFWYSAIKAGKVEMAERHMEKLSELSFLELGQIKTKES